MNYTKATQQDVLAVYDIVQQTVKTIYPNYYPFEVVDFFCHLHGLEAIRKDVEDGNVGVLFVDDEMVATGCFIDNHITRVYVLPKHQGKGYGKFIMNTIEAEVAEKYDKAYLDASMPAEPFYEQLGYQVLKLEEFSVQNDVVLTYKIMEKGIK